MNSLPSKILTAGILLVILALLTPESPARYESLHENSPFVPEGFVPPSERRRPPPPPQPRRDDPLDRIEFRSLTLWQGTYSFSIYNPAENRSYWLEEGQGEDGFTIVSFDPRRDELTISYEDRQRRISLRESRITTAEADPQQTDATRSGTRPPPPP